MARSRAASEYVCQTCASAFPRWEGQCRACGAWNSLVETLVAPSDRRGAPSAPALRDEERPRSLAALASEARPRHPVGLAEVDRVLGGGLVPGTLLLLGGEPGIGKSTLVLQAASSVAAGLPADGRVLYATAEESAAQLSLRATRLGLAGGPAEHSLHAMAVTRVDAIIAAAEADPPALLVVDSIQTVEVDGLDGPPGSVGQVREAALRLGAFAREHSVPVLLVGHVTKDGSLAGPRTLEHLVDGVLMLEGDRYGSLRLLRALKNRHGSTEEVGVLDMTSAGMVDVVDASAAFLGEGRREAPGVAVAAVLEGSRPLLVEVQALVAPAAAGPPRRTVAGIEANRLALLIAVLARRGGIDVTSRDVYASLTGGLAAADPALDLALAVAIASSRHDRPTRSDTLVVGEVSLLGEVRPVRGLERRVREAARLGFRRAIVPPRTLERRGRAAGADADALELVTAATLQEALQAAFVVDVGTTGSGTQGT